MEKKEANVVEEYVFERDGIRMMYLKICLLGKCQEKTFVAWITDKDNEVRTITILGKPEDLSKFVKKK